MESSEAADTVRIRRLVPDQWAVLRQVRLAALADAPRAFASTLDRELAFDEQRWREWIGSSACFVAWQDGQPIGLAAGFSYTALGQADRGGASADSWHLVAMWVSPRARGSGTADRLVEAVSASAREAGASLVALWVTEVNARAAAFYQRTGFVRTGRRQLVGPDQPDQWEEQMVRPLASGPG